MSLGPWFKKLHPVTTSGYCGTNHCSSPTPLYLPSWGNDAYLLYNMLWDTRLLGFIQGAGLINYLSLLSVGLRFRPTASSKVKQRVGKLQSAALRCHLRRGGFSLCALCTAVCSDHGTSPFSSLPSQIALAAALALFNDFKSLLLMSSLSPQNTAPPTASDSLPNPLITQGWS